jgi:hypothetical protein
MGGFRQFNVASIASIFFSVHLSLMFIGPASSYISYNCKVVKKNSLCPSLSQVQIDKASIAHQDRVKPLSNGLIMPVAQNMRDDSIIEKYVSTDVIAFKCAI